MICPLPHTYTVPPQRRHSTAATPPPPRRPAHTAAAHFPAPPPPIQPSPRREFEGFSPRDHVAIAGSLGLVDFQAGARVSGRAFCYLKGHAALLELALVNYAVAKMTAKGGHA